MLWSRWKELEDLQPSALGFVRVRLRGNPRGHEELRSRADAHPVHPPAATPDQRHIRTFFHTLKPGLDDQPFTAELPQPERKDPLFLAAGGDLPAHGLRPQRTARHEGGIACGL